MKAKLYLSMAVLFSSALHGMVADKEKEAVDVKQKKKTEPKKETVAELPKQRDTLKPEEHITLNLGQSVVFRKVEEKKYDSPDVAKASDFLSKSLESDGWLGWAKAKVNGKVPTLINQIKTSALKQESVTTQGKLRSGITSLVTETNNHENLISLYELLKICADNNIDVFDPATGTATRAFSFAIRGNDEEILGKSVTNALTLTQTNRGALVASLVGNITQTLSAMQTIVKTQDKTIDASCKSKEGSIKTATETKRLGRRICPSLKDDGYESDNDSKYDREYILNKLELTKEIERSKIYNERVISNLGVLLELAKKIELITINSNNNSLIPLAHQQKS